MTSSHPRPLPCQWLSWLAAVLDRRTAPRLALRFLGAVLARGRRTVTSWIRAALSRLRKDSALSSGPGPPTDRLARSARTYGEHRIDLNSSLQIGKCPAA